MSNIHDDQTTQDSLAQALQRLPHPLPSPDLADRIVARTTALPQQKPAPSAYGIVQSFIQQLFAPLPAGMMQKSALAFSVIAVLALTNISPSSNNSTMAVAAIEEDETYLITALAYDDTLYDLEGL